MDKFITQIEAEVSQEKSTAQNTLAKKWSNNQALVMPVAGRYRDGVKVEKLFPDTSDTFGCPIN